jgi:hypothetical protein
MSTIAFFALGLLAGTCLGVIIMGVLAGGAETTCTHDRSGTGAPTARGGK